MKRISLIKSCPEKCGGRASGPCSLMAYALMLFLLLSICTACSRRLTYPEAPRSGQDVSIDINALQSGVPKYYSYLFKGITIHFFVVRVDGRVISFLDACTKCYPQKKGFGFDSGSVICRACDERYPISEIATGFGSCYPVKLPGRTEGSKYLISAADLEKIGEKFFR